MISDCLCHCLSSLLFKQQQTVTTETSDALQTLDAQLDAPTSETPDEYIDMDTGMVIDTKISREEMLDYIHGCPEAFLIEVESDVDVEAKTAEISDLLETYPKLQATFESLTSELDAAQQAAQVVKQGSVRQRRKSNVGLPLIKVGVTL